MCKSRYILLNEKVFHPENNEGYLFKYLLIHLRSQFIPRLTILAGMPAMITFGSLNDTSPANDTIIGYYHILANFYAYLLLRLAETLLSSNSSALSSVSKYIEIRLLFPVIVMLA